MNQADHLLIGSRVACNVPLTDTEYPAEVTIDLLVCRSRDRKSQWRSHATVTFDDVAVVPQRVLGTRCGSVQGRYVPALQQVQPPAFHRPFDILR